MALFKGIMKLTEEQYVELKSNGSITTEQGTFVFDENYLYVTDKNDSATSLKIVESLPEVGNANTIYMILKDASTNVYDRYIFVNDRYELIGDTTINLSDYVLLSDLPTSLPASDVYEWAKQSTKPTYTLDEIDGTSSSLEIGGNSTVEAQHYSIVRNVSNVIHQALITIYDDGSVRISHRNKSENANADDAYIELGKTKLTHNGFNILTSNNSYTKEEIDAKIEELKGLINNG